MPRDDVQPGSADDWLNRSQGKLVLARQPLPDGGYWEDLCFMAQQSAELAIKAVFQHHGWRFPFIHDLRQLLDLLEGQGMSIPETIREAEKLTIYATQMRYPGSGGFMTEADYRNMLAVAEAVYAWARAQVEEGH